MHLLVIVLTYENLTRKLVRRLAKEGIKGCTIIDSQGMASVIEDFDDLPVFGILKHILDDNDEEENKTIFMVLNDEDLVKAKGIVKQVCGDLNLPNSGIMFTLPVESVEGVVGE